MFKYKKAAAFILGIMICASAAAQPACIIFADNESSVSEASSASEDDSLVSGDYSYLITNNDTVQITGYSGSDTDLQIPEEIDGKVVTEIGENAFYQSSAVSVNIPKAITYIANNPFIESAALTDFTVDEGNETFYAVDGVLFEKSDDGDLLVAYPQNKAQDTYTVPDGIKEIMTAAIYNTQLTALEFPSTLNYLERHSLSYNEKLTSLDFSETNLYEIGDMAIAYCTALNEIKFSDSLQKISSAAFAGCSSLKNVEFPDSLTYIGQNAFAATGLKSVLIPPTVIDIGYCAFGYNENLEPISDFVIYGEANSAAQTYATDSDEDYEYINNFKFETTDQMSAEEEMPEIESIPFGDFSYSEVDGEAYITACVSIESVVEVPSEINGLPVTRIYGAAFFQNGAEEIILPDSLKAIDALSFYMCSNLKKITLPDGITEINSQAFADCTSLESIVIPGTCTTIGDEIFLGCTALKEISVSSADGGSFTAVDGILYSSDKTILVAYPASKKGSSFKVPSTVTEIAATAFSGCDALESVNISSVKKINSYAFENCHALTKVKFSKELESIGTCAFYDCKALKKVRLYDNITEIGEVALGYYFDEENNTDVLVDGFKVYAPKDSGAFRYCNICDIECVTNTVNFFGANMQVGFFYALCGIFALIVLSFISLITIKSIKKRKAEKSAEKLKQEVLSKLNTDTKKADDEEKAEGKDNNNEIE